MDIVVGSGTPENAKTATVFGITNVTYTIERRCTTANTFWHIYVNLTSNGPVNVVFNVEQSDGNGGGNIPMSFTSATTQTYDYGEWGQRFTSSTNARWVQAIVTSPTYLEWPAVRAVLPVRVLMAGCTESSRCLGPSSQRASLVERGRRLIPAST